MNELETVCVFYYYLLIILTIEEKNNQVHHHFKVEKCTVLICMIAQNTFKFPF